MEKSHITVCYHNPEKRLNVSTVQDWGEAV
jgi:hypothetical protein